MQFDRGSSSFSRSVLHAKNMLMCSKSDNYTILHYIDSRDYSDSAFHSNLHPVSQEIRPLLTKFVYQSYCVFSGFLFNFKLTKASMFAKKRDIFQIVFKCFFLKPEQYELAWHLVTKLLRYVS